MGTRCDSQFNNFAPISQQEVFGLVLDLVDVDVVVGVDDDVVVVDDVVVGVAVDVVVAVVVVDIDLDDGFGGIDC